MEKKIVCQNKKAAHEYFIEEIYDAGMVLLGPEVKSLREGRANLVDSYARIKQGEVFSRKKVTATSSRLTERLGDEGYA